MGATTTHNDPNVKNLNRTPPPNHAPPPVRPTIVQAVLNEPFKDASCFDTSVRHLVSSGLSLEHAMDALFTILATSITNQHAWVTCTLTCAFFRDLKSHPSICESLGVIPHLCQLLEPLNRVAWESAILDLVDLYVSLCNSQNLSNVFGSLGTLLCLCDNLSVLRACFSHFYSTHSKTMIDYARRYLLQNLSRSSTQTNYSLSLGIRHLLSLPGL